MTSLVGKVRNAKARREVGRALHIVTCLGLGAIVVFSLARLAPPTRNVNPFLETRSTNDSRAEHTISTESALMAASGDLQPEPTQERAIGPLSDHGASFGADDASSEVTGAVLDSAGHPLRDVRVSLIRTDAEDCPTARYTKFRQVDPLAPDGSRARTADDGRFSCVGLLPGVEYDVFVDLAGSDLWWMESCARPLRQVYAGERDLVLELPYGIVELSIEVPDSLAAIRNGENTLDLEVAVDRGFDDRSTIRGDVPETLRVVAPFDLPFDLVVGGKGVREIRRTGLLVPREEGSIGLALVLEPEPLTGRILVSVVNEDMLPVSDVWLHKVTAFDPPAFEYVRVGEGSDSKNGYFVLDGLEPRAYTICALGESYGDRAPAFGSVIVKEGESRELLLMLRHGEYLELSLRPTCPELKLVEMTSFDLDFEIGDILEWSLAQRSSFGTYRTFEPGEIYRSSIRVPLGSYELRMQDADGKEWVEAFTVDDGRRVRIDVGVDR